MTVATVAFVQTVRIEALPPPLAMRGPLGWLGIAPSGRANPLAHR